MSTHAWLLEPTPSAVMETDTKERLSARITGRVQGVGFRNFTQMRARQLGVAGWVRNEQDGSVRLEAEGPRGALDDLLDAVHEGPRMARVEDVEADWAEATEEFDVFRVRR
jgi:acylphosphatase